MNPFDEFLGVVAELGRRGIRYVLIGGVAMAFHEAPRFTRDIDLLADARDFCAVKDLLEGSGYFESAKPWRFKDANLELHRFMKTRGEEMMIVDLLLAEDEKYLRIIEDGLDETSESGNVRVATKAALIELKRARNSDQDQTDIRKLQNGQD